MSIELIYCAPYRARITERACKLRQERARLIDGKSFLHPNERELLNGMEACLGACERAKRDDVQV